MVLGQWDKKTDLYGFKGFGHFCGFRVCGFLGVLAFYSDNRCEDVGFGALLSRDKSQGPPNPKY